MRVGFGRTVERAVERLGWVLLLLVLVAVMWVFGMHIGLGIEDFLRSRGFGQFQVRPPGIELVIVPLTAVAAARLRYGSDRILALRASCVAPLLPLLMAASLFGVVAFLSWNWVQLRGVFGVVLEFGPLRWLGIALAAAFTWVWMPLFPRITATLAGIIVGPTLLIIIGYLFLGSCLGAYHPGSGSEREPIQAFFVSIPAMIVWGMGALYLNLWATPGGAIGPAGRPVYYAIWSGLIMLALALIGTLSFTAC